MEEEDLYTLKVKCKGKRTVQKVSKGTNVEKNIIGLKKLKLEKRKKERKKQKKEKGEEKKENYTELQKPNREAEVYNNNSV